MNVHGTHTLGAAPAWVFERLIDPAVLQQAIPGCEKMVKTAEDEYDVHMKIGIASIKGSYVGKVRMTDQQPPHKFTLHMEGKGAPGFVKGTTQVELKAEGQTTQLQYNATMQVGGLIAAVGSRIVEAAGKKLAAEFFNKFCQLVEANK